MSQIFKTLEPLLVKAIPRVLRERQLKKPLCILRIYYFDTHAPCTYLTLRGVTPEQRAAALARRWLGIFSAKWRVWDAAEECGKQVGFLPPDVPANDLDQKITDGFAEIYELLNTSEKEYMPQLRSMLQGVARTLNAADWSKICPVTDDFVVVPADGSQFFAGQDKLELRESVPADRLKLLRSRGYW